MAILYVLDAVQMGKKGEICKMFLRRKFDVCALTEIKMKVFSGEVMLLRWLGKSVFQ